MDAMQLFEILENARITERKAFFVYVCDSHPRTMSLWMNARHVLDSAYLAFNVAFGSILTQNTSHLTSCIVPNTCYDIPRDRRTRPPHSRRLKWQPAQQPPYPARR